MVCGGCQGSRQAECPTRVEQKEERALPTLLTSTIGDEAQKLPVKVSIASEESHMSVEETQQMPACEADDAAQQEIGAQSQTESVVANHSDEIQIEGEESSLHQRSAGKAGICACSTDITKSLCCGLTFCHFGSDAGLFYCDCCSGAPHGLRELDTSDAKATRPEAAAATARLGTESAVVDQSDEIQIEGEEFPLNERGAGKAGILACATDITKSLCWGLTFCHLGSDAGLFYCDCCSGAPHGLRELDASDAKAAQVEAEIKEEEEIVANPIKTVGNHVAVDQSDEIQIEGEEVLLSQRSAGKCGFCAESTDVSYSYWWGLISFRVTSDAGCAYCRCCC